MQSNHYFVEFAEYSGLGQLTVSRETFPSWQKMQFFLRQLRPSQILNYGEIQSQAAGKVAA
jgi:hypothetical protein